MFSDGSLKDLHFLITPDVVSVDWIEMYAVTILKVRHYIDSDIKVLGKESLTQLKHIFNG